MAQSAMTIANQLTPPFRVALNAALLALVSNSSGATEPATTYANMLWFDETESELKIRSAADDAWITIGTIDQVNQRFTLLADALSGHFDISVTSAQNSNTVGGEPPGNFANVFATCVHNSGLVYFGTFDVNFTGDDVQLPTPYVPVRFEANPGTNRVGVYGVIMRNQ